MTGLARIEKRIDGHICRGDVIDAQDKRQELPVTSYRPGIVRAAVTGAGAGARDDGHPAATTGVHRSAQD